MAPSHRPFLWLYAMELLCHPRRYTRPLCLFLLLLALHLFLLFAALHNLHTALPLLLLCLFFHCLFIFKLFFRRWMMTRLRMANCRLPEVSPNTIRWAKMTLPSLTVFAFLVWLIIDSFSTHSFNWSRLRSLIGFVFLLTFCYACSAHPSKIRWHPVQGGVFLQFGLGFLILRWPPGSIGFQWASAKVVNFLNFSYNGTRFVYGFLTGPPRICGMHEVFIFSALQIIIYFGAFVALLYHFGIIQAVLSRIAFFVQLTIGTTAAESLNAAGCVFLGQTESAILIGPSLGTMTASEIHCVMTAGFACIAGSMFSAYIAFGNCPIHLLSATLMNASISLGLAKLVYPEVEQSKQGHAHTMTFAPRDDDETMLECISKAAVNAVRFVLAIGANLVAYVAMLALLNSVIGWAGELIGLQGLSFNQILGFCFFPLAWMMGVSDADDPVVNRDETMKVAELMGIKTALNEFIAYQRLNQLVASGALKGAWAKMVAIRAFISGVSACFLTACVAGMLVDTPMLCKSMSEGQKCLDLDSLLTNTISKRPF